MLFFRVAPFVALVSAAAVERAENEKRNILYVLRDRD
jgi:hypothetical protein